MTQYLEGNVIYLIWSVSHIPLVWAHITPDRPGIEHQHCLDYNTKAAHIQMFLRAYIWRCPCNFHEDVWATCWLKSHQLCIFSPSSYPKISIPKTSYGYTKWYLVQHTQPQSRWRHQKAKSHASHAISSAQQSIKALTQINKSPNSSIYLIDTPLVMSGDACEEQSSLHCNMNSAPLLFHFQWLSLGQALTTGAAASW